MENNPFFYFKIVLGMDNSPSIKNSIVNCKLACMCREQPASVFTGMHN